MRKYIIIAAILPVISLLLWGGRAALEWYQARQTPVVAPVTVNIISELVVTGPATTGLPIASDRTNAAPAPTSDVLAYITRIHQEGATWYVTLDYINWLVGDDGVTAAINDGVCAKPAGCLPNGFYIQNNDPATVTFAVSAQVAIKMQTYQPNPAALGSQRVDFATFRAWFAPDVNSPYKTVPYNVALADNRVVVITEKYVP